MTRVRASVLLALTAAAACAAHDQPAGPAQQTPTSPSGRPALIVQIVVDQMRGAYVDTYRSQWTQGLHRLLSEGAYFAEARYPYAVTVTCAGHASIGTGTVPARHGMVMNEWYDRTAKRRVSCPSDATVTPVGFTSPVTGRYSGRHMLTQAFAERLDASQPAEAGRVATFSLKPRSAIGLAGHTGDAVVWFDASGTFASSSAFGQPAWLAPWLAAHPIAPMVNAEWTRLRPESAYTGSDDDPGARPTAGWTTRFPHKLSDTGKPDATFYDRWQRGPYSDAYLTDMAIAAIDAMQLGQRNGTDFLGVSFSALDLVGHKFGPASHEVQDMLMRVDEQIGRLLAHLDRAVGRDRYVVALSADHGVADVPEQMGAEAGRLPRGAVAKTIEATLDAAWNADDVRVEHDYFTDFYLTAGSKARLAADTAAMDAVKRAITSSQPSVLRVVSWLELEAAQQAGTSDPMLASLLLSYHPDRSGDLILLLRSGHTTSTDAASHGTYYDYDRRVPVILFGSPFKAGRFEGPASPLDIAATWARLTGVALDRPYGRSLDAALR